MGVSFSAVLFVGVEVQIKDVTAKETRYDQKTGAPHEVEVESHREIWIGDRMVLSEKDDLGGERFCHGMELGGRNDNPYLAHTEFFDDECDFYIGSEIESLDEGQENLFMEVNVKVPVHIQQLAAAYKVEPKFAMYLRVG